MVKISDAAEEALLACEDYLDKRADADCDQDGFIPNEEMILLSSVRAALEPMKATKEAPSLVVDEKGASDDIGLFSDVLNALQGMVAWGIEPETDSKSVREQELCKVWANARAAIAKAGA